MQFINGKPIEGTGTLTSEMPHGGVKGSGFGKDMSTYAFDEYTAVKHVMIDVNGEPKREWHRTIFTGSTESATRA